MVSTPEQRKRWRQKYPDKAKEERRKYLERKLLKKISEDPGYISNIENRLKIQFGRLTRILWDKELPKHCENCNSIDDLHIHHIQYKYPIERKDLKRLCRRCHVLEHEKVNPLT